MYKKLPVFNTPILLLIFNRPDYVRAQIDNLRLIAPATLYIAADGPRRNNQKDVIECEKARKMLSLVDWKCELKTKFADENLGCKARVSSAIDWFFSEVEKGVIIEDDCLADPSFFSYAQELLERYKDNKQIMHISGFNPLMHSPFSTSFSYTVHPLCWGWATWRRAWNKYDVQMADWLMTKESRFLKDIFSRDASIAYWNNLFDKMFHKKIDTWDYQWVYTIFKEKGLCIFPKNNLITNVGFDSRATHTKIPFSPQSRRKTEALDFPLEFPKEIERNHLLDEQIQLQFEENSLHKIVRGIKQYFYQH